MTPRKSVEPTPIKVAPERPNRASRRQAAKAPEPIKKLDLAQCAGLAAAQQALNQANAGVENARNNLVAILSSVGLDPTKEFNLDAEGNVYYKT